MLTWKQRTVSGATAQDPPVETWYAAGGDAMAVVARKPDGYELTAWWTKRKGSLTSDPRPVYLSLEAAQAEADRLIFARHDDWSRLLGDDE